jgi:hypothetical protein
MNGDSVSDIFIIVEYLTRLENAIEYMVFTEF